MNEQQLKDFGAHARTLVEIPDFAAIDRRGHSLRVRRRAGVVGALAMVLALVGVFTQTNRTPSKEEPIEVPHLRSEARPYRTGGDNMDEGTYWLRPSLLDSRLAVEFTVPPGWNGSWVGPQHARDGRGDKGWYSNALVLEIDRVNTHACLPDVELLEAPEQVVAALTQAASTKVVRDPEAVHRFGYEATKMRLLVTRDFQKCPEDAQATYHATRAGYIPFAPPGTRLDIWVVDVDGRPIYVQKAWTSNTPAGARSELNRVIDSIRFGTP
jgi:hypothetical protein